MSDSQPTSSTDQQSYHMESLFTFFAGQRARILNQLYPYYANQRHVSGPRRPDLQQIEHRMRPQPEAD